MVIKIYAGGDASDDLFTVEFYPNKLKELFVGPKSDPFLPREVGKAVITEQIIADTFDQLKEAFKSAELKGKGVIDNKSHLNKTVTAQADLAASLNDYIAERGPEDLGLVTIGSMLLESSKKKIAGLEKQQEMFNKSDHEAKAIEALRNYSSRSFVKGVSDRFDIGQTNTPTETNPTVVDILNKMEKRVEDNNLNIDKFQDVLEKHLKNNMAKFSDTAVLKRD